MKIKHRGDFIEQNLPKNRLQLFADILKNQWQLIVVLSFILILFLLPFILLRYYNLVQIGQIIAQSNDPTTLSMQLFSHYSIYLALNIPFIFLLSLFFAGTGRILKRLSFLQGIFFFADFAKGLRENIKDHLRGLALYALIFFLLEFLAIYLQLDGKMTGFYLLKFVHYFIVVPIFITYIVLSSVYKDRFLKKLVTAVIVFFRMLPRTIIFIIVLYLPLLVLLISAPSLQVFYPIIYFLFVGIPFLLAYVLWMNHIFDILINRHHFPELYQKGIYTKEQ